MVGSPQASLETLSAREWQVHKSPREKEMCTH